MGEAEDEAGVLDQTHQLFSLGEGVGHRLVADHVKTVFQGCLGKWEMRVVGGHDRCHFGAILASGFGFQHIGNLGMDSFLVQAELPAGCQGTGWIRGQHRADHLEVVVKSGRLPVHGADEGAGTTSDKG